MKIKEWGVGEHGIKSNKMYIQYVNVVVRKITTFQLAGNFFLLFIKIFNAQVVLKRLVTMVVKGSVQKTKQRVNVLLVSVDMTVSKVTKFITILFVAQQIPCEFVLFHQGCSLKTCFNGGTRICLENNATCQCVAGFSGHDCKIGNIYLQY